MIKELQTQFGLNTKEVESSVYEVINKNNDTNVDALKKYLKKCILITSDTKGFQKNRATGLSSPISHVYYIVLDYDNNDLMVKYRRLAKNTIDRESLIDSYYERPELSSSII